ncbi:MAG: lysophospholipid acyltransferase family protein [Acidimicrobiia bacterium]
MRRTPRSGPPEPGYAIARGALIPWFRIWFRVHLEGTEHIPPAGGAIIASNHLSYLDPIAVGFAIHRTGRRPRFLGKAQLFKYPLIGWILKSARQIKVDRGSRTAPQSLEHAEQALRNGEVLVVFPEGTTTTAPDLAPLKAKTGVARVALATGLPVIPCATWGGQWFWTKHLGVKPGPGKDVWVRFGPPISFKEFQGRGDQRVWQEVSDKVMAEIGVLLAGLKAAKPWKPHPPTRKKFIKKQGEATRFERR